MRRSGPIRLSPPPGQSHRLPTRDGAELHAVVAGDGPALVLTHGESFEVWTPLWPLLLDAGHRLVAVTLPALVLRGTRDSTVKADDLLADRLSRGQLRELPGAGPRGQRASGRDCTADRGVREALGSA